LSAKQESFGGESVVSSPNERDHPLARDEPTTDPIVHFRTEARPTPLDDLLFMFAAGYPGREGSGAPGSSSPASRCREFSPRGRKRAGFPRYIPPAPSPSGRMPSRLVSEGVEIGPFGTSSCRCGRNQTPAGERVVVAPHPHACTAVQLPPRSGRRGGAQGPASSGFNSGPETRGRRHQRFPEPNRTSRRQPTTPRRRAVRDDAVHLARPPCSEQTQRVGW